MGTLVKFGLYDNSCTWGMSPINVWWLNLHKRRWLAKHFIGQSVHLVPIPQRAIRVNKSVCYSKHFPPHILKQLTFCTITTITFYYNYNPQNMQPAMIQKLNRGESKWCHFTPRVHASNNMRYIKTEMLLLRYSTVAHITKRSVNPVRAYVPVDFHFWRQGASFIQYEAGHLALRCRLKLHGFPRLQRQRCGLDRDHTRLFIAFPGCECIGYSLFRDGCLLHAVHVHDVAPQCWTVTWQQAFERSRLLKEITFGKMKLLRRVNTAQLSRLFPPWLSLFLSHSPYLSYPHPLSLSLYLFCAALFQ